ncbi:MAG: glycosyltransferase family 87 protein [Acidobacteriaceae bacterium]
MNTASAKPDQSPAGAAGVSSASAKKITSILALVLIGLAGAAIFAARINPARMDYISYWSAAKLLVHHTNPYSSSAYSLEKPLGFLPSHPLIMRNPPWALFLVAPLGVLGPRAGLFLWTMLLGTCIIFSVYLLNPFSKDNALALLFAPAIACIGSGQSSPFLLLGFALFLHFHQRRPFFAGSALLLMAIKPHLFLVFWAVLLVEAVWRRKFQILAGLASALAIATVFALAIDFRIWTDYFSMLRQANLGHKALPTVSMLLRLLIDPAAFWLTFVPSALAILWALWYYARNRQAWSWTKHGMLLILVAIAVSPYSFITDEIVLLPAIIFALNLPEKRKYAGWILVAINAAAAIVYTIAAGPLTTPVLVWTPLAWLAWFLYTAKVKVPAE